MIEEAIVARLKTISGLTNYIGTGSAARIYNELMPQSPTYPAVVYSRISSVRESAMGADPGLVHGRVQFDVYTSDRTELRNVTDALRLALQRWRGTDTSNGTTVIQDTFIESQVWIEPELIDGVPVFRTTTDVMIHFTE